MTITPVPVLPPASGGRRSADSGTGSPGDFAALVAEAAGQLEGQEACCGDTAPEPSAEDAAAAGVGSVPDIPLPGVIPVGTPDPATVPGSMPSPRAGLEPGQAVTAAPTAASAAGTAAAHRTRAAGTVPASAPTGADSDRPGRTSGDHAAPLTAPGAPSSAGPGGAAGESLGAAAAGVDHSTPAGPQAAAPADAASTSAPASDQTATAPVGSVAAPSGLTAGTAGGSTGAAPAPSGAPTTSALLDQVTPVLSRVVSRGDGEHRMMLKLHPADLGEIHLTVTVRGDRVDVEIAASAEARELLRDGASQLRSLLDPAGRGGGQLVLRDLPATQQQAVPPATGSSGPGASTTDGPGPDGRGGAAYSEQGRDDRSRSGPGPGGRSHDPSPGVAPQPPRVRHGHPGGPALDVTI